MDVLTPEQRHRNMSAIRSKDTKPEVWLRKRLFARGYRYRKYSKRIPGHPDLWLAKYNTAVFVHGCYWHRHDKCKYASMPKSRIDFWADKFAKNTERDRRVRESLEAIGVKVLIVWECSIKRMMNNDQSRDELLRRIDEFLMSEKNYEEL